ncbi:unnamed protein product [Boreogadus saida]
MTFKHSMSPLPPLLFHCWGYLPTCSYLALVPTLIYPSTCSYLALVPTLIYPSTCSYLALVPTLIYPSTCSYLALVPTLIYPSTCSQYRYTLCQQDPASSAILSEFQSTLSTWL